MNRFVFVFKPVLLCFLFACNEAETTEKNAVDSTKDCRDIGPGIEREWERLGSPIEPFGDGHLAPSLAVVEDEIWLYYSQRIGIEDTLYRLSSDDGENWSTPTPLSGLDALGGIKHLSVMASPSGFSAILGGGRIGVATSDDGLVWNIQETQIIETTEFDAFGQIHPIANHSVDHIWYSGFSGTTYAIGLAEKTENGWVNAGPVIQIDSDGRHDNTAVAQSAILEGGDGMEMFYGGYDTSQTDPGPWRILSAWSEDGRTWSKQGLALDILDSGEEAWSVREPALVQWQDALWMAYVAMGDDSVYRLRMARCSGASTSNNL